MRERKRGRWGEKESCSLKKMPTEKYRESGGVGKSPFCNYHRKDWFGKHHQWILNLGGNFDKQYTFRSSKYLSTDCIFVKRGKK